MPKKASPVSISPKVWDEIKKVLRKAQGEYLELTVKRLKKQFQLQELLSAKEIDPKATGDLIGNINKITLQRLKSVAEALGEVESIAGETSLRELPMFRMADWPTPWLTPEGRGADNQRSSRSADPPRVMSSPNVAPGGCIPIIVCEDVGGWSREMKYICTSTTNPDYWIITWKDGGYDRFREFPPLAPPPTEPAT